jgi:hypothetical protein
VYKRAIFQGRANEPGFQDIGMESQLQRMNVLKQFSRSLCNFPQGFT